jgi:Arc/MetJ-type ribon-helix-helix transcriptional regulator
MPAMERVTVTLPADLVERIDRLERNRSRFIAEAVEHELTQRRRDALLRSVQNPHPDTTELVDIGLGDWVSDLSGDETLVDANGGTPVRWVEGQGWMKESA